MKHNNTKLTAILAAFLIACMMLTLFVGCTAPEEQPDQPDQPEVPGENETPSDEPEQLPDVTVRGMVLSGTTGFGMAHLMQQSANGATAVKYDISVEADASLINAALIQGSVDIAALPTNAASVVFNKSQGKIQLLALNTRGVLYLLDNGNGITSFADLKGKTVYVPAQNPSFIFRYLCEKNGLVVGKDITIDDTTYAAPAELQANVASGNVTLAVLPEPMVTITKANNKDVKTVLDLTAEWDKVSPAGSLVQGCIVVRKEFAEQYPTVVAQFLKDYETSINYLIENPKQASEMIAAQGIFAKAAVAEKAIPNCNVCFVAGEEMKSAMSAFLEIMHGVAPASVGGAIPGDDFYYIAK